MSATASGVDLTPDPGRVQEALESLSTFIEPDTPGWTRRVFSDAYLAERNWVHRAMVEAGLETHIDSAGNVVGELAGSANGPAIVVGSHTDTVHGGGRFDGIVGVLAAIEVIRCLKERDQRLVHDLRVVDFLGEEANSFGLSCLGSRAVTGSLTKDQLDLTNPEGESLGAAIRSTGLDPDKMLRATWDRGDIGAYVELHIEQGPRLERSNTSLGVVTGIAGIERLMATFVGHPDHAGTMPMDQRRDALVAAAEVVLAIEQMASCSGVDAVATTGRIDSQPGAFNIVPDWARIWAELRCLDQTWLGAAQQRLTKEIADLVNKRGVDCDVQWLTDQASVPVPARMQDVIAGAIDDLGMDWMPVPSGAGHDAAHLIQLAPMGMIFVPSRDGKSHCPEEWTDLSQITDGVRALGATVLHLDQKMPEVARAR